MNLFVFDLDGTLLSEQNNPLGEILPKTREALLTLRSQGHQLVLASGRCKRGMTHFSELLDFYKGGYLIGYNGGLLWDCLKEETLFSQVFDGALCSNILSHLVKFDVTLMIDSGETMYLNQENRMTEYECGTNHLTPVVLADFLQLPNFPVHKILVYQEEEKLQAQVPKIIEPFQTRVAYAYSAPVYFEITPLGINKAQTLKRLQELLRPQKTIAFGDGENDLGMLALADISIAMKNAEPKVQAACDMITDSNDEEGIFVALQKLGFC